MTNERASVLLFSKLAKTSIENPRGRSLAKRLWSQWYRLQKSSADWDDEYEEEIPDGDDDE